MSEETPCSAPEARQFDFWIGKWDLTWENGGKGSNVIESTFGGCVITENFDGNPGMDFKGMSVSTYNKRIQKWQQTWVDDQGTYFDLIGEFNDGEMVLIFTHHETEGVRQNKMRFYNIEENSLDWSWEGSKDSGESWSMMWAVHYERKF